MKNTFLICAALLCGSAFAAKPLPDIRQGTIDFVNADGEVVQQSVEFENVNGLAIYEGDIILGKTDEILYGKKKQRLLKPGEITTQGHVETRSGAKWLNGRVPFVISSAFDQTQRNNILTYMREIEAVAKVQFVPRNREADYINIVKIAGNVGYSYLGRQGGAQNVSLPSTGRRLVTHELFHALGVRHEHTRADRDSYIVVHWDNIKNDFRYAFEKNSNYSGINGRYDYGSIMHYYSTAFAIDVSKPTLSVKSTSPAPIPPIDTCIPGQICQIPYSSDQSAVTSSSVPTLGGATMSAGDKASLVYMYGAPLVQPYVSYISIDWMRCTTYQYNGMAAWESVGSGASYQLEQLFGSTWSTVYSGTNSHYAVYGSPGQTLHFRVRAIRNGTAGSWNTQSSRVPNCGLIP